jgi:hypothetical protein
MRRDCYRMVKLLRSTPYVLMVVLTGDDFNAATNDERYLCLSSASDRWLG